VIQAAPVMMFKKFCSSDAILPPNPEAIEKNYPEKIQQIVTDISKLTIIEVSDLNELLKVKSTNTCLKILLATALE
jgi:hypothetical protein